MRLPLKALPAFTGFDGDDPDDTVQGGNKDDLLTQDQFNKALAEDRRKHQAKYQQLEETYNKLLENKNLTDQQRNELETNLEEVRSQFRTKEQQAEHERNKLVEKHSTELKTLTDERDKWRNDYTNMVISNSLLTAAGEAEAYSAEQIEAILRPQTSLREELDEQGQKTGRLVPKVKMTGKDKDGKSIELDLSVGEAVKMMKETPERYGNLFKSTATGGLGSNTTGKPGQPVDVKKLSASEYRKLRKENPGAIGL